MIASTTETNRIRHQEFAIAVFVLFLIATALYI